MPAAGALISINEKEERSAQRAFYDKIEAEMSKKRLKKLKFWKNFNTIYAPAAVISFMTLYWLAGLKHSGAF